MTESGGLLSINAMDGKNIDSVGFILDGIKMKVINPITGQTLGPNQPGEICFSVPSTMMLGYYNNPTETKKMIDEEGKILQLILNELALLLIDSFIYFLYRNCFCY